MTATRKLHCVVPSVTPELYTPINISSSTIKSRKKKLFSLSLLLNFHRTSGFLKRILVYCMFTLGKDATVRKTRKQTVVAKKSFFYSCKVYKIMMKKKRPKKSLSTRILCKREREREREREHRMKCMCGGMQASLYIHCVYYTVYKDYDENIQCILYTRRRENDAQKKMYKWPIQK